MNPGSFSDRGAEVALTEPRPAATGFFRYDGAFLRGLASLGARYAPAWLLKRVPAACGLAFALAMPGKRRKLRANLRRILGPRTSAEELLDVTRTFIGFAGCLTDALAMGRAVTPEIELCVIGDAHLREVLAAGRGAILATAHTGGWEIAGPLLAKRFAVQIMIAMRREPNGRARAIQDRARAQSGMKVVHIDGEPLAVLPLFTHLRRGGVVGVQIDRTPEQGRAFAVELFGMPGRVPSGPFELARASGAPIVPVFARRRGYLAYDVEVGAPIHVARQASAEELVRAGRSVVGQLEAFLSAHPTDWFDFGT